MNYPLWLQLYEQTDLFGEQNISGIPLTDHNTKVIVGQFFEFLTFQMFDKIDHIKPNDYFQPDFVIWNNGRVKHDILLEVKATSKSHIFDKSQVAFYRKARNGDIFPYLRPEIFYVLFFYKSAQPLYLSSTAWNLVQHTLPKALECCVVLPLEVIEALCKGSNYSYGLWGVEGREHYSRMSINITSILRMGKRKSVINAVKLQTGEDVSKKYMISRYNIEGIKVLGCAVDPFPVIVVSKNGLRKFLKKGGHHDHRVPQNEMSKASEN